jgi:hypothetical protein
MTREELKAELLSFAESPLTVEELDEHEQSCTQVIIATEEFELGPESSVSERRDWRRARESAREIAERGLRMAAEIRRSRGFVLFSEDDQS